MWGPWFFLTSGGLLLVLLLIGIAFGTSALLFPVIAAALIAVVIVAVIGFRRSAAHVERTAAGSQLPRSGGAPVSGEGSGAPTSSTGASERS